MTPPSDAAQAMMANGGREPGDDRRRDDGPIAVRRRDRARHGAAGGRRPTPVPTATPGPAAAAGHRDGADRRAAGLAACG